MKNASFKNFLLCGIILFVISLKAQPGKIDSLSKALKTVKADTNKINILMALGNQYLNINPDTTIYLQTQCILLAEQLNNPLKKSQSMIITAAAYLAKGDISKASELFDKTLTLAKKINAKQVEGKAYSGMALIFKQQTNFPKAIEYHTKSLAIFESLGIKSGIVSNLGNMGNIYKAQSDYPKALECYTKVMKMQEELGDKNKISITLGNMGNIFKEQGNYSKAIDYYFKALRIDEEFGNKAGVARHFGNLGTLYMMQEDNTKALDYFLRSLKMNEELGFKEHIATNLGNIGLVYFAKKDYSTALNYYQRAIKLNEELGNSQEILINLSNIGSVYQEQGDNERALATQLKVIKIAEKLKLKNVIAATLGNIGANYFKEKKYGPAEDHFKRALALNLEIGLLKQVTELNRMLHNLYVTTNDNRSALIYYKNYILYRDSLLNKENSKKQVELEMQYSFDKKEALADAEQAKKDALSKEELDKQRMQRNGFIIGFALMIALAAVIYRNFRTKSKANAIISRQKEEVELQREIAENQKALVEEKNKEILDSITYAKRLQLAILPPENFVKDLLPDSFILYKPKDIVAGDFYWMHIVESSEFGVHSSKQSISQQPTKNPELILIAAADCTGHGVPGAIVSVVCSNALNRSVKEFGLTDPEKILDKVRELVVETFERSESEVKDGMDIALCSLQKNNSGYTLKYSGANNPLWLIRKNTKDEKFELFETRADKQPIGKYPNSKPFTTNTIELQKGDTIYIFTDGYGDQFGGDSGKKLKTANSKKLLLSLQEKTMQEQFRSVDDFFETWKGKHEQVDDVCMIGIRV